MSPPYLCSRSHWIRALLMLPRRSLTGSSFTIDHFAARNLEGYIHAEDLGRRWPQYILHTLGPETHLMHLEPWCSCARSCPHILIPIPVPILVSPSPFVVVCCGLHVLMSHGLWWSFVVLCKLSWLGHVTAELVINSA